MRKKDNEKIEIINTIFDLLVGKVGFEDIEIENEQKEITFRQYSLTLIKHRPPKE